MFLVLLYAFFALELFLTGIVVLKIFRKPKENMNKAMPKRPFASSVLERISAAQSDESADKLSDVKISIGGDHKFSCHRFILCACSKFFRDLLHIDSLPSNDSIPVIAIKMKGIPHETFGQVLDAIYRGENKLTENNMLEMWHAAHNLQIDFLEKECEDFITKQINLANYTYIFEMATIIQCDKVLKAIYPFLTKHFDHFATSEIFSAMSKESFLLIIEICGESIKPSDLLVKSILKWVSHKLPKDEDEGPVWENHSYEDTDLSDSESEKDKTDKEGCKTPKDGANELKAGGKKKKRPLEAIFLRYHDEDRVKLTQEDLDNRRKHIGLLFKRVKFDLVSNECLNEMLGNDVVMDSKEARNIVVAANAQRIIPEKPKQVNPRGYLSYLNPYNWK